MINLMLPADKQRLRRDYQRRLFILGASLFFSVVLIVLVVLASFYFLVHWQRLNLKTSVSTETTGDSQETERLIADLREWRATAARLSAIAPESTPIDLPWRAVHHLLSVRTSAINLTRFQWQAGASGRGRLLLEGRARGRSDFLGFLETLRQAPYWESVESPLGNLIQERDLSFAITLEPHSKTWPPAPLTNHGS